MSAFAWRTQMRHAPKLVHDSDGLVLVQLGERSVVFPSAEDTRFFFEAYTDVPNLIAQVISLRERIDENALSKAQERAAALEAEVGRLREQEAKLQVQLAVLAEKEAATARRARVLAQAVRRAIKP